MKNDTLERRIFPDFKTDFKIDFKPHLNDNEFSVDPYREYALWLQEARDMGIEKPTIAILASVDEKHFPTLRPVNIWVVPEQGFLFYTNPSSDKVKQFKDNPQGGFIHYWYSESKDYYKHVRVEGKITPTDSPKGIVPSDMPKNVNIKANGQHKEFNWQGYLITPRRIKFVCDHIDNHTRIVETIEYQPEGKSWKKSSSSTYYLPPYFEVEEKE